MQTLKLAGENLSFGTFIKVFMRGTGFEPVQALSHDVLSVARLTALATPHAREN